MLEVSGLRAEVDGREVVRGASLTLGEGEVALLLGPNGSGKSSLIQTLLGNPRYEVTGGRISLDGRDLTGAPPDERAAAGLGAVFQMPPSIRGITLRSLLRKLAERFGSDYGELEDLAGEMGAAHLLDRDLHVGFSGGEMKRAEVLLLMAQRPKVSLLDEPDSGVDLESLPVIGRAIAAFLEGDGPKAFQRRSALVVTHTGHIARYLRASRAFVMIDGTIRCFGDATAVLEDVERLGFEGCARCLRGELVEDGC